MDFVNMIETSKIIITLSIFTLWSLYDILTKKVVVSWQLAMITFGMLYNVVYLSIDKNQVNDNITGFIVCFVIAKTYDIVRNMFGGDLGGGDVIFYSIVGLFYGTAVGVLTFALSMFIFNVLLRLFQWVFRKVGTISVAFFPFITGALAILVLLIGEQNIRNAYYFIFHALPVSGVIKLF